MTLSRRRGIPSMRCLPWPSTTAASSSLPGSASGNGAQGNAAEVRDVSGPIDLTPGAFSVGNALYFARACAACYADDVCAAAAALPAPLTAEPFCYGDGIVKGFVGIGTR